MPRCGESSRCLECGGSLPARSSGNHLRALDAGRLVSRKGLHQTRTAVSKFYALRSGIIHGGMSKRSNPKDDRRICEEAFDVARATLLRHLERRRVPSERDRSEIVMGAADGADGQAGFTTRSDNDAACRQPPCVSGCKTTSPLFQRRPPRSHCNRPRPAATAFSVSRLSASASPARAASTAPSWRASA